MLSMFSHALLVYHMLRGARPRRPQEEPPQPLHAMVFSEHLKSSDALSFAPELERGPILFLFVVG